MPLLSFVVSSLFANKPPLSSGCGGDVLILLFTFAVLCWLDVDDDSDDDSDDDDVN